MNRHLSVRIRRVLLLYGKEHKSMNNYRIDPKKQFSKKLARWTAVFWFVFMTWLSVLLWLRPEAALYAVYMAIIATAVMILNVWAYTRNSIYEKGVFAMLDKAKLELSIGKNATAGEENDADEETVTEGVSNG